MVRFVKRMGTDYANLCDHVIAPSESIADVLTQRGVTTPITAIPTGINPAEFACGDRTTPRQQYQIPEHATVIGHVGRLAPEKNLDFLSRSIARALQQNKNAYALIVGEGPSAENIEANFANAGVGNRLVMAGKLKDQPLANAYRAMDLFAFASHTETQGMVLAEAMSVGLPVVALDAPGAREVVIDQHNGRLLSEQDETAFAEALQALMSLGTAQRAACCEGALQTAEQFAMPRCVTWLLSVYEQVSDRCPKMAGAHENTWSQTRRLVELEWHLWSARANAAAESLREGWRARHG
jgi:glycosyltransferase involved in cell wall biosynthesis